MSSTILTTSTSTTTGPPSDPIELRAVRAKEILFRLFNRAATGAMRPWQLAFYGTQHTLAHLTGSEYHPDELQLRILEEILMEYEPMEHIEL